MRLIQVPYVALSPIPAENPELAGRTYTGKSLEDALINARADLTRQYKGIAIPIIEL